MSVLTLGLYAEGTTDYTFLQPIIQRTAEQMLAEHERGETDIRFLYQPMGEKINLKRLRLVPSYHQFVTDMTTTLKNINIIS